MRPTKLLKRINELAKKSKEGNLTKSEKTEQKKLREQYLKNFRKKFSKQLDNIKIVRPDN
ncbi:MAG: DUF896 domain-containing protein [Fusobacteriota bacterium]